LLQLGLEARYWCRLPSALAKQAQVTTGERIAAFENGDIGSNKQIDVAIRRCLGNDLPMRQLPRHPFGGPDGGIR